MTVKSLDSKPLQIPTARVESTKLETIAPVKQEALAKQEPDSGFAQMKKKLVNTTGRYAPVAKFNGNSELAGFATSQLRVAQTGNVGGATKASAKLDADVMTLIKGLGDTSDKTTNADFKALCKAMKEGKWSEASKLAKTAFDQKNEEFIDEKVPASTNKTNLAKAMTSQIDFLAKMEAKGVKGDLPPTKEQLKAYFRAMKDDPKGAQKAFEQYAKAFHVHTAQESQDPKADVRYGGTEKNPLPPSEWSQVEGRKPGGETEYVGKRINDCEGYAYMAQELLKEAGFDVKHITANGGPAGAHAMVVLTHTKDPGNVTITSNDGVFHGAAKNQKKLADDAFKYAGGKPGSANKYYAGDTMAESQKNAGAKKNAI